MVLCRIVHCVNRFSYLLLYLPLQMIITSARAETKYNQYEP